MAQYLPCETRRQVHDIVLKPKTVKLFPISTDGDELQNEVDSNQNELTTRANLYGEASENLTYVFMYDGRSVPLLATQCLTDESEVGTDRHAPIEIGGAGVVIIGEPDSRTRYRRLPCKVRNGRSGGG